MSEFERKPDGGLNNWIETYEAMGGGENDAEMLCLLLELRRRRENQTEAERERDELKRNQELNLKIKQAMHERFTRAEAELARRDAAAGEAVAWQFYDDGSWHNGSNHNNHRDNTEKAGYRVRELFPASPPAVLPPEMDRYSMLDRITEQEEEPIDSLDLQVWAYNLCLKDIKSQPSLDLGAQQQKPVVLPGRYDISEMSGDPFRSYRCIEPDDDGEYIRRDEMLSALDDAGVPYEVKK